jgi:hypothetical protein
MAFFTVQILEFRVTRRQRWCLLAKKNLFRFFKGSSACLYNFFSFNMVEKIFVVEQIFEFMFSRNTQTKASK